MAKLIRINDGSWRKIKKIAYETETPMIKIFDEIMNGRRDPVSMEIKEWNE
jgi:hypothetical protein